MTDEMSMEALLAESDEQAKRGAIVEASVVSKTETHLVVNIGLKQDALLSLRELDTIPPTGSTITVLVVRMDGPDGHPLVSWKMARETKNWDKVIAQFKANEAVDGRITKRIKGGLLVDIGLDAFLPASQIDLKPVAKPEEWVGQSVRVRILEMDAAKRNVLVSRRKLLEEERAVNREKTLASVKEGDVVTGVVAGLTNFGAFVDIGGLEGLLHVSDMDWARVDNPKKIVKVGETISVKVLKYDTATQKISLGRKQLLPHPWDGIETKYPIGSAAQGKVTSVTSFGAFVQLTPGIEGLIHISELSWTDRVKSPKEVLKAGQMVDVKIIAIDRAEEKISLSLKRAGENPWEELARKYPNGTVLEGTVTHLAAFGAFVKLPEGLEALIKTQDMSWTERIQSPKDKLKVGDTVKAVVLEVNPREEKMSLGLKQLTPDPMKNLKIGQAVNGVVAKVTEGGIVIKLDSGVEGFVRNAEIQQRRSMFDEPRDRNAEPGKDERPKEGEAISATVLKLSRKDRKLDLSVRRFEQSQEKELLRKYSGTHQKLTLGDATGWTDDPDSDSKFPS